MNTKERFEAIPIALNRKPPIDAPCNQCGWCCLVETCDVGIEMTPPDAEVCAMLRWQGDKYFCAMAKFPSAREHLHIGEGCNAISVKEKLEVLIEALA